MFLLILEDILFFLFDKEKCEACSYKFTMDFVYLPSKSLLSSFLSEFKFNLLFKGGKINFFK